MVIEEAFRKGWIKLVYSSMWEGTNSVMGKR